MTADGQGRLRATLTFSLDGTLESVFLLAGADQEETILRQALRPVLKQIERRQKMKDSVRGAGPHGMTRAAFKRRLFWLRAQYLYLRYRETVSGILLAIYATYATAKPFTLKRSRQVDRLIERAER